MSVIAKVYSDKKVENILKDYCYAVKNNNTHYLVYASNLALAYLTYKFSKKYHDLHYQIVVADPDSEYVLKEFTDISLTGKYKDIFKLFVTYNSTFIKVLDIYFNSKNIVSFYNKIKKESSLSANAKYLLQSIWYTDNKFSFKDIIEYVKKYPDKCLKFILFYDGIVMNIHDKKLRLDFILEVLEIYGDAIFDKLYIDRIIKFEI